MNWLCLLPFNYILKFAVVDIETTGLFHQGHDITEIAVVHIEDGTSSLAFHSLIYTTKLISSQISGLTGISNKDTNQAPRFAEIVPELLRALEGRIFVAHNVNFDYQFLKANLEKEGISFSARRLCTMRMAKKVLPDLHSYKLVTLCNHFAVVNAAMHRADGDAWAATNVLLHLMELDNGDVLKELLSQKNRNAILPPGISKEMVDLLPESSGVYYFYNDREELIYIGKAKNLKKRVLSHFTSSGSSRKKQIFQRDVSRFDYQKTENEYEALLVEDREIKAHWPALNVAQKYRASSFAILPYHNRINQMRFGIVKTKYRKEALGWFTSSSSARFWLQGQLAGRMINPKRGGFFSSQTQEEELQDDHQAVDEFISEQQLLMNSSYALLVVENEKDNVYVAVINGKYRGYGRLEKETQVNKESILDALTQAPDSLSARAVIQRMMNDENVMKYEF